MFTLIVFILILIRRKIYPFLNEDYLKVLKDKEYVLDYLGGTLFFKLVISALPFILINNYMRENGFFALEVFDNNYLGFKVLSLNVIFNITFLSISLFAYFLIKSKNEKLFEKLMRFYIGFVNILVLFYICFLGYVTNNIIGTFIILIVFISVFYYVYTSIKKNMMEKSKKWYVPYVTSVILFFISFHPYSANKIVDFSLRQMSIGSSEIRVIEVSHKKEIIYDNVWLLLRTNHNIYIKEDRNAKIVTIIPANEVIIKDAKKGS